MVSAANQIAITPGDDDRFFHHSLYRQIRYIEHAILIICSVSHLLMLKIQPSAAHDLLWNRWTLTVVFLLFYFVISRVDLVERSLNSKIFFLALCTFAACGAYIAGYPTMINPLFATLVARATLFVDAKPQWRPALAIYACLFAANFLRFWFWQWEGDPIDLPSAVVILVPTFFYGTFWQGIVLAMVALLVHALVESKKQMIATEKLSREMASMAADLERARIARDIHDGVGHSLTSLSVQLEVARKLSSRDPEKSEKALSEAEKMAKRCLRDVRNSIGLMRADSFDFGEALSSLLDGIESGGCTEVQRQIEVSELEPLIGYQIFRIIQESCTNALKHGAPNKIEVSITKENDALQIVVHDNGKGFDATGKFDGFGLTGIRERVSDLNGSVEITSRDGEGTRVNVSIPLS